MLRSMIQSRVSPRAPKAQPTFFVPPIVDPTKTRRKTRASLTEVDEPRVYVPPEMDSALKPLLWLAVPLFVTLALALLTK